MTSCVSRPPHPGGRSPARPGAAEALMPTQRPPKFDPPARSRRHNRDGVPGLDQVTGIESQLPSSIGHRPGRRRAGLPGQRSPAAMCVHGPSRPPQEHRTARSARRPTGLGRRRQSQVFGDQDLLAWARGFTLRGQHSCRMSASILRSCSPTQVASPAASGGSANPAPYRETAWLAGLASWRHSPRQTVRGPRARNRSCRPGRQGGRHPAARVHTAVSAARPRDLHPRPDPP